MSGSLARGLRAVSTRELRAALSRCAAERSAEIDAQRLKAWGCSALASWLDEQTLTPGTLRLLLDAVIAEREAPEAEVDLVWTGPHPRSSTARDTRVVLRDLFASAHSEVIVAGYTFDHGEELLRPLFERLQAGVRVAVFLDVPGQAASDAGAEDFAAAFAAAFLKKNWPFGEPVPELYFDPRTVSPSLYASMHAKCVVVDRRTAMVGSANFTERGQTRNIELGVVVEDVATATELAGLWWAGVQGGSFKRIEG